MEISCVNCANPYPTDGLPFRCSKCGGLYDFITPLLIDEDQIDRSQPGIWRYQHTFNVLSVSNPISLGEGCTPLLWADALGRKVGFKCEFFNPTGSFKDRGSAIITALLKTRGIGEAVEDSSGNAGSSFAAYAACAGIKARIYVPSSTSGPKRRQIEAYGAELIPIHGSRSEVADAVKAEAEKGEVYASHAYLPFNLFGYATAAYEIFEQLGNRLPGAVILPVGQGGLLLGLVRGFEALRIANHLQNNAIKIIGVQASACAPLLEMFNQNNGGIVFDKEGHTLAEGVQVQRPLRGEMVIRAVKDSGGSIFVADEDEILFGRNELAQLGFFVEPTSAIVLPALKKTLQSLPDPVIVILSGSGYKYE